MEKKEYEFYSNIKPIGTSSYVLVPVNVLRISGWSDGDTLVLKAKKLENNK